MIKKFSVCPDQSPEPQQAAVNEMLEVLKALSENRIPGDDTLGADELHAYVGSLVLGQRPAFGNTVAGSWSVALTDEGLPFDARVDFIFVPTYAAVATLGWYLSEQPERAGRIEGLLGALQSGLHFCTHRGLYGSGYDADEGLLQALQILVRGKIPQLLQKNPGYCPKLKEMIEQRLADVRAQHARGPSEMSAQQWTALVELTDLLSKVA